MSDQDLEQGRISEVGTSRSGTTDQLQSPDKKREQRKLRKQAKREVKVIQNWLVNLYAYQETMSYLARRIDDGKPSVIDQELSSSVLSDIENIRASGTFTGQSCFGWKVLDAQAQALRESILSVIYQWDDENSVPPSFSHLHIDLEWLSQLTYASAKLCQVVGHQECLKYEALNNHTQLLATALINCGRGLKQSADFCDQYSALCGDPFLNKKELTKHMRSLYEKVVRRATKQIYRSYLPNKDYYTVEDFVPLHHDCEPDTIIYHMKKWNIVHEDNVKNQFTKEKVDEYQIPVWLTWNANVAQDFLMYLQSRARRKKST